MRHATEAGAPEPRRHKTDGMGAQSPEEIERDLARTRSDLNDTLHAIENRLSPGQLVDQALDYLRGGPRDFAVNLGAQARDNPMPVALTALGVGWLMFATRRPEYPGPEYTSEGLPEEGPGLGERGKEIYGAGLESLQHLGETAGDKGERIRETLDEKRSRAREGMERTRKGVRHRAHAMASGMRRGRAETASSMRHGGERARDTFSHVLNEQPLVLGALGIALGAVLAAGLPTTRREQESLGPVRDEAVSRVGEFGKEEMGKTREELKQAVSEPPPPATH